MSAEIEKVFTSCVTEKIYGIEFSRFPKHNSSLLVKAYVFCSHKKLKFMEVSVLTRLSFHIECIVSAVRMYPPRSVWLMKEQHNSTLLRIVYMCKGYLCPVEWQGKSVKSTRQYGKAIKIVGIFEYCDRKVNLIANICNFQPFFC